MKINTVVSDKNRKMLRKTKIKLLILVVGLTLSAMPSLHAESNIWVGTWGCAPYAAAQHTAPAPYLANNTVRQIVRVSIGGDTLRVRFSNRTSANPVTMNKVNIAVSTTVGGSTIDASTLTALSFEGQESVTMAPFSEIVSDPIAFNLEAGMQLAITTYYGQCTNASDLTFHYGSRTDSYILEGDQATSATFSGATPVERWYHINTIDVQAPDSAGCIGVLGNSITDGYGLHGGLKNTWTDIFSQSLLDNEATSLVGVVNMGIGGTLVTTSGLDRYKKDLLELTGLRWIFMFYGTNDIGANVSADRIVAAYQQIIDDAHTMGVKVVGGTITPFKGSGYYSEAHEAVRQEVNTWIKTPGNFDAVVDFSEGIRSDSDPIKMKDEYANDYLHPNAAGYAFLGRYVDVNIFAEITEMGMPHANAGDDQTVVNYVGNDNVKVTLDGSASSDFGTELAAYQWSIDEEVIANGVSPSVELSTGEYTIVLTVTDDDGNVDSDEVLIAVVEDAGVWLEAECATVGNLFDIVDDANASNGKYVTVKAGNNTLNDAATDAAGWLTFDFDVEESGEYSLYARLICPNANDDSYWLKMDDQGYSMWNGIGPGNSWFWESFTSTFNLDAGTHTLTISYREDGAKLDKLWLTNQPSLPNGMGGIDNQCNTSALLEPESDVMKVVPSVFSDKITCTNLDSPSVIRIYNIEGKLLLTMHTNETSVSIPMEAVSVGMYLVQVQNNRQVSSQKIIKR